MSLVSSNKLLYGRDIPAQKYSQLTSAFDGLELYKTSRQHTVGMAFRLSVFVVSFTWRHSFIIFYVVSEVAHNDLGIANASFE